MQVRLTTIDLALDGQVHPVGAVLVVGDQIPAELAERRLAARTAELVVSGEAIPATVAEALAALERTALASLSAARALLDLVEPQPPAVVLAVVDALAASQSQSADMAIADRWLQLHQVAAEARHATDLVQGGNATADTDNPAESGGVGGAAAEAPAPAAKPKAAKAKFPAADPGGGA